MIDAFSSGLRHRTLGKMGLLWDELAGNCFVVRLVSLFLVRNMVRQLSSSCHDFVSPHCVVCTTGICLHPGVIHTSHAHFFHPDCPEFSNSWSDGGLDLDAGTRICGAGLVLSRP